MRHRPFINSLFQTVLESSRKQIRFGHNLLGNSRPGPLKPGQRSTGAFEVFNRDVVLLPADQIDSAAPFSGRLRHELVNDSLAIDD